MSASSSDLFVTMCACSDLFIDLVSASLSHLLRVFVKTYSDATHSLIRHPNTGNMVFPASDLVIDLVSVCSSDLFVHSVC